MSNFVGTLLSIIMHFFSFFLVFLMFLYILILYKLDHSYICPQGKTVKPRLKLSIMFAPLGQLAAEINW